MAEFDFEIISSAIKHYHPSPDIDLLKNCFEFAQLCHQGQVRASGEAYFIHPCEVALLTCRLKLDQPSIMAALLHDVVEDCDVTVETIKQKFGKETAEIVDGVTNLGKLEFDSKELHAAESFRKMFIAMARDIRVILVKLCDRLHNMRTLGFVSQEKQIRKALETKEIYAPLANRLGLFWMKSELEDISFKYLRPELYQEISDNFDLTAGLRGSYIKKTSLEIAAVLENAGISASVKGRHKHFYSIWQKMERLKLGFNEIHDLLGFRIIVASLRGCYESLGVIHSHWNPVPGSFKDYIAMPKPNMYQSLHTQVIGPEGKRIEVQIRSVEMDRIAEEGVAAHWRYKEAGKSVEFDLQWVKDLVESQAYISNPDEFIQSVKSELFPKEVFVFTPQGRLIRLPIKSTPIDFAYYVHSDVGNRASGAKVNGSIVPLSHVLENGDTVEIITSKNHVPSKDWLDFIQSSKAKQKVRQFIKSKERETAIEIGTEVIFREFKKAKINLKEVEKDGKLLQVASEFGITTLDELYAELGYGKLSIQRLISKFQPDQIPEDKTNLEQIYRNAAITSREKRGVKVSGLDDIMVRFGKCCEPLWGDRIVGFITRGRGVTVHRADCPESLTADSLRLVPVSWDDGQQKERRVKINIISQDQRGLLATVSKAITDAGGDIKSANISINSVNKANIAFEIMITDAVQLQKIIRAIEMIPGIIKVTRIMSKVV